MDNAPYDLDTKRTLLMFAEWCSGNEYIYSHYNTWKKTSITNLDIFYTKEQLIDKFLKETNEQRFKLANGY